MEDGYVKYIEEKDRLILVHRRNKNSKKKTNCKQLYIKTKNTKIQKKKYKMSIRKLYIAPNECIVQNQKQNSKKKCKKQRFNFKKVYFCQELLDCNEFNK